jgi:hypothetical protein
MELVYVQMDFKEMLVIKENVLSTVMEMDSNNY